MIENNDKSSISNDGLAESKKNLELSESNKAKLELLDQKFIEEQKDQEERLLFDFDEVVKEVEEKPFTIKFHGKYYEIPANMPLDFSMFFFRHCFKKRNGKQIIDCPEDKISRFVELMIGKKFLIALEQSPTKVGFETIMDKLATPILAKWGYGTVQKESNQQYSTKKK